MSSALSYFYPSVFFLQTIAPVELECQTLKFTTALLVDARAQLSLNVHMVVQIPLDLIEWVIDYLHDDKHALYACSLVHPDWLPTARYHTFRSVELQ